MLAHDRWSGVIVGIFVGGRSRRMGRTKATMLAPSGVTLVERCVMLARSIGATPVLVGRREDVPAIAEVVDDAAIDAGPLGGLVALLDRARGDHAIALACDMPFIGEALLRRLIDAPPAIAIAPKRAGRWEPLFARYDADRAITIARERLHRRELAMHALLDALAATELAIDETEARQLDDWDSPDDVTR
jgi:molybdopterin-guanine dinucleotide biosynthesis protein A